MLTDIDGFAIECNFFKKTQCNALDDFYNASETAPSNCVGCPFFKTKEQLKKEKIYVIQRLKLIKDNIKRGGL